MLSKQPPIRAVVVAAVAVFALIFAPAALAAKPSGGSGGGGGKPRGGSTGGTGTVSVVLLDSTDGVAHWGQRVTFKVTTSMAQPWVTLKCYQNNVLVSQSSEGFFAGALDDGVFGLYSGMWSAGAADCTATLSDSSWAPAGSTSFHVAA